MFQNLLVLDLSRNGVEKIPKQIGELGGASSPQQVLAEPLNFCFQGS